MADFLFRKTGKNWTDSFVEGTSIKDIDSDAVKKFQNRSVNKLPSVAQEEDTQSILERLDLISDDGTLRRAGILLFGKKLEIVSHSAFVQVGKFSSLYDVISTDIIEGNLFEQADQVIEILRLKYLRHRHEYKDTIRYDVLEYPEVAIREMVYNAIIHKDYLGDHIQVKVFDNEIECWNAGSLIEPLTTESLKGKHRSIARNGLIAKAFYLAGYVERWGRGTTRIVEECVNAGLPEPIFEDLLGGLRVTLSLEKEKVTAPLDSDDRQKQIILYLEKNGSVTNKDVQTLFGVSRNTASSDLKNLVEQKLISNKGTKGSSAKYFLI